jgi:GLTT repeat (6 copies)
MSCFTMSLFTMGLFTMGLFAIGLINQAIAALVKNFDRSIEGTLRLYNLKGFHFKPQTRLALADVKIMLSIP